MSRIICRDEEAIANHKVEEYQNKL